MAWRILVSSVGLSLTQAKQLQIHTFASLSVALHRGNAMLARSMFSVSSVDVDSVEDSSLPRLVVGAQWCSLE